MTEQAAEEAQQGMGGEEEALTSLTELSVMSLWRVVDRYVIINEVVEPRIMTGVMVEAQMTSLAIIGQVEA